MIRAIVSDALPGVTPETNATRFVGYCCAWAATEMAAPSANITNRFMSILLEL
jgi:hypothetical protein